MIFFLTLLFFFIIIFIISLSTIKIRIKYLRKKNNDQMTFEFSILRGRLKYQIDIPKIDIKKNKPSVELEAELESVDNPPISDKHKEYSFRKIYKRLLDWYPIIKKYLPAGSFLLKKVTLRKVKWQTEIGLFDAAQTGISVGILWAVKSMALSYVFRHLNRASSPPDIKIIPLFNQKMLAINIDCIFDVKIGYIMITGLKCLRIYIVHLMHWIFCFLRGEFGGRTTTTSN